MTDWKKRARDARKKLQHARHGERETVLQGLAGDNDPNTVRRAMFALGYLDDLRKTNSSLWQSLQHTSLSLVELLARWHSFDEAGATKAAREVAQGRYTVADLRKAVSAARVEVAVKSESQPYAERVKSEARLAIREALGGSISTPEVGFRDSDDPPLDFRYTRMYGKPPKFESIVAIIVGPYQDRKLYRKRRHDWLYRALGLAWFYDHVFLVLPEREALDSYRSWIEQAKRRAELAYPTSGADRTRQPRLYAIHPKLKEPQLTDEQTESLAGIAKS
jgi:hypothetical protein